MANKLRKVYVKTFGRSEKAKSTRSAMLAFAIRLGSAAFIYLSHIILARWLGSREFGIYTYAWTWVIILGSISTLGFSMVMVKNLPIYLKRERVSDYLGLMFFGRYLSFFIAILITIIGIYGVQMFSGSVQTGIAFPLMLALICVPLFAIVDVQEGISRANDWIYLGLLPNYLLRPVLILIFFFIMVYFGFARDASSIMMACIIASGLTALVQLILVEINIAKKVTKVKKTFLAKPWLALAFPLLLTDSFMIFITNTDIVMMEYFLLPEDIAVYFAAVKTTLLAAFIYYAADVASASKFAEYWDDDNREKLTKAINHSVTMTFLPSLVASLGIMLVGYWFLAAYGEEFTRGYMVIVILSIGAILRAATGPTEWMMTMMGQQKTVLWTTGVAAVVNIILNFLLIPIWGLEGAASATAITMAGVALFLFVQVRRGLKIAIKFAGLI